MKEIVVVYNNEPRVSSVLLAKGFCRAHRDVLDLLLKYKIVLESFGILTVEPLKIRKLDKKGRLERGRPVKDYLLNEGQATFLVTLFKNTEQVVKFKANLVRDFLRCKTMLRRVATNRQSPEWSQQRIESKSKRIEETDKIKEFVAYAKSQGSTHADWYYSAFSQMVNRALFVVEGKYKNIRDMMTLGQLTVIGVADVIVGKTVTKGMSDGLFYKEIFRRTKANMILLAEMHGQSEIIAKEMKQLEPPE